MLAVAQRQRIEIHPNPIEINCSLEKMPENRMNIA